LRSSSPQRKPRARVPDGVRVYAIGDIHGRADLLAGLLNRIEAHIAANQGHHPIAVFLGDYIDRGPASQEVLEQLAARDCAYQRVFLKGNHETYLADFIKNPTVFAIVILTCYKRAADALTISANPKTRRKIRIMRHPCRARQATVWWAMRFEWRLPIAPRRYQGHI